jgi:hypothetical protein
LELSRVPPCLVLDWKPYPEAMTTSKEKFDYLETVGKFKFETNFCRKEFGI